MAVIRDIVNEADRSPDVAEEIRESLILLMEMAEAKGQFFLQEIEADLKMGKVDGDNSLTVPISKVIERRVEYRAVTKNSSDIGKAVAESLSSIYSGDEDVLKGMGKVVDQAFKIIMGAGEGNESTVKIYSVVTEYPAIVRFDFAFWGRNIRAESVRKYVQSAFACVAFKSTVDVSKLTFNDFLAVYGQVLAQAIGKDKGKLLKLIEEANEVYEILRPKPEELEANVPNLVEKLISGTEELDRPLLTATMQAVTDREDI